MADLVTADMFSGMLTEIKSLIPVLLPTVCEAEAVVYHNDGDMYMYRKCVSAAANAQMRINWLESMDVFEFDDDVKKERR